MRKMSERRYGEYLKYCLPKQWVAEEEGDMSSELRKTETFVEFVYDEGNLQAIPMKQAGGEIAEEEFSACRIFFPLTREYHSSFFVGANEDYTKSVTFGILPDKTELISYVCDLIAQENTSE